MIVLLHVTLITVAWITINCCAMWFTCC